MGGKAGEGGKNWLLKKIDDDEARPGGADDILARMTTSVATGRTMDQIANNTKPRWRPSPKRRPAKTSSPAERPDRRTRKRNGTRLLDPSTLEAAIRTAMPAKIAPELPTLVKRVPGEPGWIYELKLDGYRIIAFVRNGKVSLYTRRGLNWTHRFPTIAAALEKPRTGDFVLDGEIVVLRPDGRSDFQALQNVLHRGHKNGPVLSVFDLLYLRGYDLRQVPLSQRKQLLSQMIDQGKYSRMIRYNDHISGEGEQVFSIACRRDLEGIVAKRTDSHYVERRTADWVKTKCKKRQEFVIGGWTRPGGDRTSLGALLVGYHDNASKLVYAGRVGTGSTKQSLRDVHKALLPLEQKRSPFEKPPSGVAAPE